jgi:hypothetical protein
VIARTGDAQHENGRRADRDYRRGQASRRRPQ